MKKRCFVIGPMAEMERFHKLVDEIIKPLLDPYNYDVIIPLEGNDGQIMHHVLLELERADLLIADISGNNPNVMYELGIYHSLGKAYIAFKDRSFMSDNESTPFDIQSYRFQLIDINNATQSIDILKPGVKNLIDRIDYADYFKNPVTDFYNSPVAEIPTAVGLAKNYRRNFLDQLVPLVFNRSESDGKYIVQIKEDKEKNENRILNESERDLLKIRVLIPEKLEYTIHDNIRHFKETGIINSTNWAINRKTRPFGISLVFENDYPVIVDIPTVLATLYNSIKSRRNINEIAISASDWEDLERKELERFSRKCLLFKESLLLQYRNRVEIITNWSPEKKH
jgi:hypothetical protein